MKLARLKQGRDSVLIGLALSCFLSGCAVFDSDGPFDLIKPEDAWIRMQNAPQDADLLAVANRDEEIHSLLIDTKRFKLIWFQRGTDDYLLYFQAHRYVNIGGCDEYTFEMTRTHDQWSVVPHLLTVCAD